MNFSDLPNNSWEDGYVRFQPTIKSFINSLSEEDLWKIIEDYETYGSRNFKAQFLMEKALEYSDEFCYKEAFAEYTPEIALLAYRHFALKYKESMKK